MGPNGTTSPADSNRRGIYMVNAEATGKWPKCVISLLYAQHIPETLLCIIIACCIIVKLHDFGSHSMTIAYALIYSCQIRREIYTPDLGVKQYVSSALYAPISLPLLLASVVDGIT